MNEITKVLVSLSVILVLVLLNGFFVASEFALVTVRKTRIDQLANEGNSTARMVQKALQTPNILISATQLGVTMATLILGSTGEPIVSNLFGQWFGNSEWVFVSSTTVAYVVSYILITAVEIVIGELVPKSIARQQTERTAMVIIRPLSLFVTIFRPFILLLDASAKLVLRFLHIPLASEHETVHSEEELKMLVTASTEGGVLEESEEQMLHRVFDFRDRQVHEVMMPRTEMVTIPATVTLPELLAIVTEDQHTRFPVYEESPDNIIGVVHVKDLLTLLHAVALTNTSNPTDGLDLARSVTPALTSRNGIENSAISSATPAQAVVVTTSKDTPAGREDIFRLVGQDFDVRRLLRPVMVVPETMRVDMLMAEMKKRKTHLAIAIDEYGGTAGLVTLEDLLEEIIGDVSDEFDVPEEANIQPQPDGSNLVNGLVTIDRFNDFFEAKIEDPLYDTIAGFVLGQLGRKPVVGDEVKTEGFTFRVEKMEGLRIALLRVTK